MTITAPVQPVGPGQPAHTAPGEHVWELRAVEFEDGQSVRRFECTGCGAARFD